MNGFIIIDKPVGITSHGVVSRVRRILGTKKVGHTGTLDPFATGVLPVAVNEGTKAIPFLDEGQKCYQAVMRLGVTTDTLDMTGKILGEADYSKIDEQMVRTQLTHFTGAINQVPPMFSAIKLNGQPLYKLARQGQDVERKPRQVEIYSLELISFQLPFVEIKVVCSRGTYIRSLAEDIGNALGCGAALQELRRTASGSFAIKAAISLEALEESVHRAALEDAFISSYDALSHLPDIPLTDSGLLKISHGISPVWEDTTASLLHKIREPGLARLSREKRLVAVATLQPESDSSRIVLKRVFN